MPTLSTLNGSTAQVNWAKGIRKKRLEEIERNLVLAKQGLDVLGTVEELEELQRMICSIDHAKGFIDTRDEPLIESPDRKVTLGAVAALRVNPEASQRVKDIINADAPAVLAQWHVPTED